MAEARGKDGERGGGCVEETVLRLTPLMVLSWAQRASGRMTMWRESCNRACGERAEETVRTEWPGGDGAGDGEPRWASRQGRLMRAVVFGEDVVPAAGND